MKWIYNASDHENMSKLHLFQELYRGSDHLLNSWGRIHSGEDTDHENDSSEPVIVNQQTLGMFEFLFVQVLERILQSD